VEKTYVEVQYKALEHGIIRPERIKWHDGRVWNISKTLHVCSAVAGEFKGLRYTVLIGKEEKYLYQHGDRWYVETISTKE